MASAPAGTSDAAAQARLALRWPDWKQEVRGPVSGTANSMKKGLIRRLATLRPTGRGLTANDFVSTTGLTVGAGPGETLVFRREANNRSPAGEVLNGKVMGRVSRVSRTPGRSG